MPFVAIISVPPIEQKGTLAMSRLSLPSRSYGRRQNDFVVHAKLENRTRTGGLPMTTPTLIVRIVVFVLLIPAVWPFPAQAQGQMQDLRLTWIDRSGKTIETVGNPGPYRGPELSPDGNRIAVHQ